MGPPGFAAGALIAALEAARHPKPDRLRFAIVHRESLLLESRNAIMA